MISILKNEKGAIIVESTLVLPIVFCTILLLIFFSLFLYQNAVVEQTSAIAAERVAFSWNNSARDQRTGAYAEGSHDPLFWRLSDDGMLQSIFGGTSQPGKDKIELPAAKSEEDGLALRKLSSTGQELPSFVGGQMNYSHELLTRTVKTQFHRELPISPLHFYMKDSDTASGQSVSYIVEPTEWIRTVELARYFTAKFKGSGDEGKSKSDSVNALKKYAK